MNQRKRSNPPSPRKPREYQRYTRFGLARNFKTADYITICNALCGTFSILTSLQLMSLSSGSSLNKDTMDQEQLRLARWAFGLPYLGALFDTMDGKVARWTQSGPSMLGQELDSLSDLISFGVAPIVLAFIVGLRTWLDTVLLTIFACCGLARLARFNVTTHTIQKDEKGKAKYFEGLPIPTSLTLVTFMWVWFELGWLQNGHVPGGSAVILGYPVHLWSFSFLGWAFCMVSHNLKVPKF